MVRVPSRLITSVMVPRGAVHEIMPPRWPHTPRNLHTPPARRCISALCHRPELRRAHADGAVGSTTRRDAVAHVLRQRRVRALRSQARSPTPLRPLPLVCARPSLATASSPARSTCMVGDVGASPLQVPQRPPCSKLLCVARA